MSSDAAQNRNKPDTTTTLRHERPLAVLQGYYRIMGARAAAIAPLIAQVPSSGLLMLFSPAALRALEKRK